MNFKNIFLLATLIILSSCNKDDDVENFDGFNITKLGNAELSIDNSQLVIGNIGSSGNDGVSIDLNSATDSWTLGTDEIFNTSTLSATSERTLKQYALQDGNEILLETTTITTDGTNINYDWDFSPSIAMNNVKIEFLNDGVSVLVIDDFPDNGIQFSQGITCLESGHSGGEGDSTCTSTVNCPSGTTIVSPIDGLAMLANQVVIEFQHQPNVILQGYSKLELTLKNIDRGIVRSITSN